MRFLIFILLISIIGCKGDTQYSSLTYCGLIDEYFYHYFFQIDQCYPPSYAMDSLKYSSPTGPRKNNEDSLVSIIEHPSENSFSALRYDSVWNELFPGYIEFYNCRSFKIGFIENLVILLRRGKVLDINQPNDIFDLSWQLSYPFKENSLEAIKLFLGMDFSHIPPVKDILKSDLFSSIEKIDYEDIVLEGKSKISTQISQRNSIMVIEYGSVLINRKKDRSVLLLRMNLDGSWETHLSFFEKIANRWNLIFDLNSVNDFTQG